MSYFNFYTITVFLKSVFIKISEYKWWVLFSGNRINRFCSLWEPADTKKYAIVGKEKF